MSEVIKDVEKNEYGVLHWNCQDFANYIVKKVS